MSARESKQGLAKSIFCVAALGLVGSGAGQFSGLSGGAMAGAFLVVAAGNLVGLPADRLPRGAMFWVQALAGVMIGVQMTTEKLAALVSVLPPLLLIVSLLLAVGFMSSLILHRFFGWDFMSAWLASSPGRMQDMIILASSLNARSERVAVTHIVRIALVIMATPVILALWT